METKILTGVTIRKATVSDIPGIVEVITPYVNEGKLLPRTLEELDELVPTMFVAEHEGKVVGCAALEIYSRKLAEVRSLAVSRSAQGMGVGKLLVQACVDLAIEKNVLEVMAITSSDAFFMSCGFGYTLPGEKRALFIQTRDNL